MSEDLLEQYRDLAKKNAHHIEVLNREMGETAESVKELNEKFANHTMAFIEVKTDVKWLKKNYWIIAGAAGGGLVAGILNLLFK